MKIKNNTPAKVNPFTVVAIIGVLCLSFFVLTNNNTKNEKSKITLLNNDLENPTILKKITYVELFETTDHELYSDATLNIYIANT